MDSVGGGVLVAVAAVLWIAYLIPSWLRRRQYLATERNAVRLQQTLRILAETAETPQEVRLEATARAVASQRRILREHEEKARLEAEAAERVARAKRRAAELERAAAEAAATEALKRAQATADRLRGVSRKRVRRARAACSLVMLAALLTVIGGSVATLFGASGWIVAGAGGVFASGLLGVVVLARAGRVRAEIAVPQTPVPEAEIFTPFDVGSPERIAHEWTPRPLPRPLHLSRGSVAATAMASIDAANALQQAAAAAARDARAAELVPQVASLYPRTGAAAGAGKSGDIGSATAQEGAVTSASAYASMGVITPNVQGDFDLDEVLRRRRTAS